MHDSEVVAAIVAGNPDGLAQAYDKYASALYTYCRSLLNEPADAADAVQDTFVIAASRLAGLRDPHRLRPWLYAVARNECHRRRRDSAIAAPAAVPELTDESADVTGSAERAELRTLLRSAVRGLGAGEQDLIELQLRQELDVAEIASVLGISRNHAHALLSRARDQLEISLGALLVARSGRADCAALAMLLQDWDGQLNVLMRKRINRHIERCPACTDRKRRELAPALLLGLGPLAALPFAAAPAGLRSQLLKLASSHAPEAVVQRAGIVQRTASFGPRGFPKPPRPPKPWWRTQPGHATAVAGAALVVGAVALTAVALTGGPAAHHDLPDALGQGQALGQSVSGVPSRAAAHAGRPGQTAGTSGPARGLSAVAPGASGGGGLPVPKAGASPAPTTGGSAGGAGTAGASGGTSSLPTAPAGPGTSPAAAVTARAASSPAKAAGTAGAAQPSAPGTVTVSPTSILLNPLGSATLTVTASGGPVTWSISEPASLAGKLTASPSSGTLAAGQSATVTLSASGLAAADSELTLNPGGRTVTVLLSLGL